MMFRLVLTFTISFCFVYGVSQSFDNYIIVYSERCFMYEIMVGLDHYGTKADKLSDVDSIWRERKYILYYWDIYTTNAQAYLDR